MTFGPHDLEGRTDAWGAFGEARDAAQDGRAQSFASFDAATIRFVKAVEALVGGDADDADRWIRRAARMPYDDYERIHPGLAAATMGLFDLVHQAMEASGPTEPAWLRAAERVVAGEADGTPHLLRTLQDVEEDFRLGRTETRLLRALLRDEQAAPSLLNATGLDADDIATLLREVAHVVVAYGNACTDLGLEF
ncbi:MAG: hypothetical protein ABI746_09740 [Dermatophilaceae bacterium]